VGAVIGDKSGRVLALERADIPGAWQFPQGGLEKGERPIDAVFREIREETGIPRTALKLMTRYPDLLAYELPHENQSPKTGMGQVQYWFFFSMKVAETQLRLPPHSEFRSGAWVRFDRVLAGAVSFRKPVYRKLLAHFRKMLSGKVPAQVARRT